MNPPLPSADEALAGLRSLRESLAATAKREDVLLQGRRLNQSRRRGDAEEAAAASTRRLAADLADADAETAAARERWTSRRQRRRAWIDRAQLAARRAVDEKIRALEGQGHYDRQKHLLLADREREQAIANARDFHEEVRTILGEAQRRQSAVEQRARHAVRGFFPFSRQLHRALTLTADLSHGDSVDALLEATRSELALAEAPLAELEKFPLAHLFRLLPVSAVLILGAGAIAAARVLLPADLAAPTVAVSASVMAAAAILWTLGLVLARRQARVIREHLTSARSAVSAAARRVEREEEAEFARIEDRHRQQTDDLQDRLQRQLRTADELKATAPERVTFRFRRALDRHERLGAAQSARLDRQAEDRRDACRRTAAAREAEISATRDSLLAGLEEKFSQDWSALVTQWQSSVPAALTAWADLHAAADRAATPWTPEAVSGWTPPAAFPDAVWIGSWRGDAASLAGTLPRSPEFQLPDHAPLAAPLLLRFPDQASLVVAADPPRRPDALAVLNQAVFRLLADLPAGRVSFTLFDPVGLGESFSALLHLADHEDSPLSGKVWTQTEHIERRLAELNEHLEKVIQMYLRNEYASITDYNAQAGNIAEKHRFLVVADFPHGFSPTAAQRLLSLATSGPRCGVHLLLHRDLREPLPPGIREADLLAHAVSLAPAPAPSAVPFAVPGQPEGLTLELDAPPAPDVASAFLARAGRANRDASRVEVPFSHIAPAPEAEWSIDTVHELRVPIGRTGATKLQYLTLGQGTRQHVLVAGKTGSGKSTLFHVLVTNLALWCDPDQVEFYLIDFKKGVEFQCYARNRLPHARVVAIESDREFGLSVLQKLDDELRRRGERFRDLGVQDLAGYAKAGGPGPMPRCLLLIDEFQEFFTEDDRVAQNAALLLDRIVRQGRAFGMHVVLGSQTLGGAFTLARATLGQMVIRIALQCNEADSYLILDDSNPAARLLSRPGEGIYNDSAGTPEGNSPFQVVWLDDDTREARLQAIRRRADASGRPLPGPLVFAGNLPADVRDDAVLAALRASFPPASAPAAPRFFLGAPNAIKGPTEAVFRRQAGSHLLFVGQADSTVAGLAATGLVTLSAQFPPGPAGPRFVLLDATPEGSPDRILLDGAASTVAATGHDLRRIGPAQIDATFADWAAELRNREAAGPDATGSPPWFLFLLGLQRFRKLKAEDDFSFSLSSGTDSGPRPDRDLASLIQEGAAHGLHLVVHVDTYANLGRFFSRKALGEFGLRVLFQMSAADSSSLIDTPKAAQLGLHRALLHHEAEGTLETFRPYAPPDPSWFTTP
jgi:ABC-type multidrug transport system fused ATPase/permease subunit